MPPIVPIVVFNERDFDLLFIEEVAFSGAFRKELARKLALGDSEITSIEHSVHENFGGLAWGETDILVRFANGSILLIENKVSARFQPEQAARYRARASVHSERGFEARTALIAPEPYLAGVEPSEWDYVCSYEEIASFISDTDPRSDWKRSLLENAGSRAARVKALAGSSAARKAASAELAAFKADWLAMIRRDAAWKANPQSGSTDEFSYRPASNPYGLSVWHHPMSGYLSIQNLEKIVSLRLDDLAASLPEGFKITRHPSSVYLDAIVPSIDMSSTLSQELDQVLDGMETARRALDLVESASI
ncbi:PDDEXK-like family protein [Maritimibacter alexandrii]|uniref:PD-(D/E)XK nuclease family protein n=1 Tax=Maritimibacter alexandrii TaxID=2570355 RepID=UPI001486F52E|nr:PD-(D/E)XK nuclease family protein [Maritimibacter alexandrii]